MFNFVVLGVLMQNGFLSFRGSDQISTDTSVNVWKFGIPPTIRRISTANDNLRKKCVGLFVFVR
jgi:hypothetical protein